MLDSLFRVNETDAMKVCVLAFVAGVIGLLFNAWGFQALSLYLFIAAFRSWPELDEDPDDTIYVLNRDSVSF